jgi:hypothetical protein
MTFFRMDTDDTAGRVRAYLGEGEFTEDPFEGDRILFFANSET